MVISQSSVPHWEHRTAIHVDVLGEEAENGSRPVRAIRHHALVKPCRWYAVSRRPA
jgi:hypothetical protein